MKEQFPKSVLITQGELKNFAGSEIVTLELAEYFNSKGSIVHVFSNYIGMPIEKEFKKLKNVILHTKSNEINFADIELIWIHHQLIPKEVLELAQQGQLKAKIIFHHMSSFHPLEFPFAARIEHRLADLVLFNSHKTKKIIEEKLGGFGLRGKVFNNPAPDYFKVIISEKKYRKKLKHVLVVSNHVPEELALAIDILKKQGIKVKVFGILSNHEYKRISPIDLAWADTVIAIGKTVQYAILSGVPVYCYDHFGGCGYLTNDYFAEAARFNFSGRGFTKKKPTDIASELVNGYTQAQNYARQLHNTVSSEYLLSSKVSSVITDVIKIKKPNKSNKISVVDKASFEALSEQLWSLHGNLCALHSTYQNLLAQNNNLTQHVEALEGEIKNVREQLMKVQNSQSWKITKPLRAVNKTTNKIFKQDKI